MYFTVDSIIFYSKAKGIIYLLQHTNFAVMENSFHKIKACSSHQS